MKFWPLLLVYFSTFSTALIIMIMKEFINMEV